MTPGALPRLLLLAGGACTDGSDPAGEGSGDGRRGPVLRNDVSLEDDSLARQALDLLGAPSVNGSGVCKNCHSLGRPTLTRWSRLTQTFASACLGDSELEGRQAADARLACFWQQAGQGEPFAPQHFGIYAAAAHLPWFSAVFEHASGIVDRARERESFVQRVGMPRAGDAWTQAQFDVVAEWFARKAPRLLELVPADEGEACSDGLDQAGLSDHVEQMATAGWRAKNAQAPMLHFGCPEGQSGGACLDRFPLASASEKTSGWQALGGAQIRVLHDNSSSLSTYWSRVSADGRYLASGLRDPDDDTRAGQIIDLADARVIPANFRYDATFFPDASGFVLQQGDGSERGAGASSAEEPSDGRVSAREFALTCDSALLGSKLTELTGAEPECRAIIGRVGLYQQLAKSVDGDDYWVVHGSYTGDDGGFDPVLNNPSAAYDADSRVTLTALLNVGDGYRAGDSVQLSLPRQGDPMLSPSGHLLATRIKGRELGVDDELIDAEHAGYALYRLSKSVSGSTATASVQDLGRICVQGGKPSFSYDERWLVFHRYVTGPDAAELGFGSPDAEGFGDYLTDGSSNLYLADLSSGILTRLTHMPPGEFALFPHFRSDGWIYFVVRTLDDREYFAASDAALALE